MMIQGKEKRKKVNKVQHLSDRGHDTVSVGVVQCSHQGYQPIPPWRPDFLVGLWC